MPVKIAPARLEIVEGFDGYCSAKPYGGEREHERAVRHEWEPAAGIEVGNVLFCVYCGAFASYREDLPPPDRLQ
jgi:hypothetical protein